MLNKVHTTASPAPDMEERGEEEAQTVRSGHVRVGRRSGIMNLMDFVRRNHMKRHHHHRKIVDLTQSVNAAEMAVIESRARASAGRDGDGDRDREGGWECGAESGYGCVPVLSGLRRPGGGRVPLLPLIAWALWVLVGTVFFSCYDRLGWALGFFQSMNIGWSVGWVLPVEDIYEADAVSVAFSVYHTLVGVLFSGLAVLFIAKELGSGNRGWAFQGTTVGVSGAGGDDDGTTQNSLGVSSPAQQQKGSGKGRICVRVWVGVRSWVKRCRAKLSHIESIHLVFVGWFLLGCGWYWLSFHRHGGWAGGLFSVDYTVSTLAGAGYRGVPTSTMGRRKGVQYVLSALYAAVAIPLTRISEGLLIGVLLLESKNKSLSEKIVQDISEGEIEAMNAFFTHGGGDGGGGTGSHAVEDHLQLAEFTLLIALRVGAVSLDTVSKIQERFRALDRKHEQRISYEDVACSSDKLRLSEERKQELVDTSYSIRSFLTIRKMLTQIRAKKEAADSSSVLPRPDSEVETEVDNSRTMKAADEVSHASLSTDSSLVHSMWSPSATSSTILPSASVAGTDNKSTLAFGGKHESAVAFKNRMSLVHNPTAILEEEGSSRDVLQVVRDLNQEEEREKEKATRDMYPSGLLREDESATATSLSQPYKGRLTNLFTFEKTRVESFADYDDYSLPNPNSNQINDYRNNDSNTAEEEEEDEDDNNNISKDTNTGKESDASSCAPSMMVSGSQRFSKARHLAGNALSRMENGMSLSVLTAPDNRNSCCESRECAHSSAHPSERTKTLLSRAVKAKLASISALQSGLKGAQVARQERLAQSSALIFVTRSHAMLRRAHKKHVERKNYAVRQRSKLATASFYFFDFLFNSQHQALLLWVLWLTSGTIFFWLHDGISLIQAFYQSVNTGYGVFLTKPVMNTMGHTFVLLHLLVGTMVVSGTLTLLANSINYEKHKKQIEALTLLKKTKANSRNGGAVTEDIFQEKSLPYVCTRVKSFALDHLLHLCFFSAVLSCTLWASLALHWPLLDGLYFTVSLLSTSGQVALPVESPDWHFFVVSAFAAIGVPLMAMSMGLLTHTLSQLILGDEAQFEKSIGREIGPAEVALLRSSGLEDGNGYLEISEFALLMLLRIGALHPDFLKLARYRFMHLKEPGATLLSIHKIGTRTSDVKT